MEKEVDSGSSKSAKDLTQEEKVFIATIYSESSVYSNASGVAIANVIMNRVGSHDWTRYTTVTDIIAYTGFDAYGNDDFNEAMDYMNDPDNFTGYVKVPEFIDDLIRLCLPVYNGEVADITKGAVFYYSPAEQARLHNINPNRWPAIPSFLPRKEVEVTELSSTDDFKFYLFDIPD